nr:serine hydrolase [Cytophagales bacterium]
MEEQPLMTKVLQKNLETCLRDFVSAKQLNGVILTIHRDGEERMDWEGSGGNLKSSSPFFLTDVSYMFLAALVLKLRARGKWKLTDKLSTYIPSETSERLLVRRGKDLTNEIELGHLLAHRSGVSDFMMGKSSKLPSLAERIAANDDFSLSRKELLKLIKNTTPAFAPGSPKRLCYSHSNYHLLVLALEYLTHQPVAMLLREFQFKPLGMNQTYTYDSPLDRTPSFFYHKDICISVPKAIHSFGVVGGLVSTASDSMAFLRAFFHGNLFPVEYLDEMQSWVPAGNGMHYGMGLSKYEAHGLPFLFSQQPTIIGMTGFSGAFALYVPEKKIYFTGTVNQLNEPHLPFKLVQKICKVLP